MNKNTYFVDYPRNFANEYTVYQVSANCVEEFEKLFTGAKRITARRANELWRSAKQPGYFASYNDAQETFEAIEQAKAFDLYNATHATV